MKTFLISRPDAIGDVVLTLPMSGWLKKQFKGCKVIFLGTSYTEPVVACCEHVDEFINADQLLTLPAKEQVAYLRERHIDVFLHVFPNRHLAYLARAAGIPTRVGTRNRWFHWFTCNKLVPLSRKNSDLHESQLNLLLLSAVGVKTYPALEEMHQYYGFTRIAPLPAWVQEMLEQKPSGKLNIILHPKSRGSGREWSLSYFGELARQLHQLGHQVFVTGTAREGEIIQEWLKSCAPYIKDLTGRLSLPEFISLTKNADGLVASGTGTLHIAAAVGVHALGIFPPIRPVHPGRWRPIGSKASALVHPISCNACNYAPENCACMNLITPEQVIEEVKTWELSL